MANPFAIGCKTTSTGTTCQYSDTEIPNPKGTLTAQTEAVDGMGYIVLDIPLRAVTSHEKADPSQLFTGAIEKTFVEVLYKNPYLATMREVLMFKDGLEYVDWLQEKPAEAPDGLKGIQRSENIEAITYHEISSSPVSLPVSSIQFDSYEIAESLLEAPEAFIVIDKSGTVLHQSTSASALATYASQASTPEAMILVHLQNDNPDHTIVNGETIALGFSKKSTLKAYAEHVVSQNEQYRPQTSLKIRQEAGRLFGWHVSAAGTGGIWSFDKTISADYQDDQIASKTSIHTEWLQEGDSLTQYGPGSMFGIQLEAGIHSPNWRFWGTEMNAFLAPSFTYAGSSDIKMFDIGLRLGVMWNVARYFSVMGSVKGSYSRTSGNLAHGVASADYTENRLFQAGGVSGKLDVLIPIWEIGDMKLGPFAGVEGGRYWGEFSASGKEQNIFFVQGLLGLKAYWGSKKTDPEYTYTSDPVYIGGDQRLIHRPIQTQTWTEAVEEPAPIVVRQIPGFSVVDGSMFNIESEFSGGDQFNSNSPYLTTSGTTAINKVAQGIQAQIELAATLGLDQYQIEGNTTAYADLAGSAQYNMVLSKLRAGLTKAELTPEEQAKAETPLSKGTAGTHGFKLNLIQRLKALIPDLSDAKISITADGLGETRPYVINLGKKRPGGEIDVTAAMIATEHVLELDSEVPAIRYYYQKTGTTYKRIGVSKKNYKKVQDTGYALIKVDGEYYLYNLSKTRRVVADVKVRFTDLEVNYSAATAPAISPVSVSEGYSSAKVYNYSFTDSGIPPKADKVAIAMLLHKKVPVDSDQQLIVAIHLPQNTSASDQRKIENYLMLMANQHTDQPARFITIKDSAYTKPSMSIITGDLPSTIFTSSDTQSTVEGSVGYKIRQAMDGFAKQ